MWPESAGPVSVPTTTTQEEKPSSGGGPGTPGPAGSVQVRVTLGYPSGLAGPTDIDTQERGRKLSLSPPELDYYPRTTHMLPQLSPAVAYPAPASALQPPPPEKDRRPPRSSCTCCNRTPRSAITHEAQAVAGLWGAATTSSVGVA